MKTKEKDKLRRSDKSVKKWRPHPGCLPARLTHDPFILASPAISSEWRPSRLQSLQACPMHSAHAVLSSIYLLSMFHHSSSHHYLLWLWEGQKTAFPCDWVPLLWLLMAQQSPAVDWCCLHKEYWSCGRLLWLTTKAYRLLWHFNSSNILFWRGTERPLQNIFKEHFCPVRAIWALSHRRRGTQGAVCSWHPELSQFWHCVQ